MPLRESVEDGELRLHLAAHNSAIANLDPCVSRELISLACDAVEKLARDVPAAKHEVSGKRARKTDKRERCVASHSVDRPLNPANGLPGHRW